MDILARQGVEQGSIQLPSDPLSDRTRCEIDAGFDGGAVGGLLFEPAGTDVTKRSVLIQRHEALVFSRRVELINPQPPLRQRARLQVKRDGCVDDIVIVDGEQFGKIGLFRTPDGDARHCRSTSLSRRNTFGNSSGRSSAIRPGPNIRAVSACSQAAMAAASNELSPCAMRPPIKPASTSPEPAVANAGGA